MTTTVGRSRAGGDVALQRGEEALAVDRLDEVLGGAEREPAPALVDHRDDHDREARGGGIGLEAREHVPAVEPRQAHVEDHRDGLDAPHELEAVDAVARDHDGVPGALEVQGQQVRRAAVVLDDDDGPGGRVRPRRRRPPRAGATWRGSANANVLPSPGVARHPDPPPVELDDLARQREAEAGALGAGRRGAPAALEGLEDPLALGLGDPDAGVGDRHLDLAVRDRARRSRPSRRPG